MSKILKTLPDNYSYKHVYKSYYESNETDNSLNLTYWVGVEETMWAQGYSVRKWLSWSSAFSVKK